MVAENGSPLKMDGLCVCHAFMSVACVSCVVRPCSCFICMVWVMVAVRSPWKLDGVVLECVVMNVWWIMNCLCMLVFTCVQVCSDVVVIVVHEVTVCAVYMIMH